MSATMERTQTTHMQLLPAFDNRTHYKDPCSMCSNRGHYPIGEVCPQCNGAGWVIKPRTRTQLPVITGKPYTPKRTIKPYDIQVECTDAECPARCYSKECGLDPDEHGSHLMRHHAEPHTHSKTVPPPANGSGWLERKASGEIVYHTPWLKPHKPFAESWKALQHPKARNETAAKAFARICKEYMTPAELSVTESYKANGPIGRGDGQGYVCKATNGHWAVMERGEPTADAKKAGAMGFLALSQNAKACVITDSEFHNAVKRAVLMADERNNAVCLAGDGDAITLYSSRPDAGEFLETLAAKSTAPWRTCFNADYLEPLLGCWPLRMWVKDEESAVVFEPVQADGSAAPWRVVVMPLRDNFCGMEKAVKDAYPNWGGG